MTGCMLLLPVRVKLTTLYALWDLCAVLRDCSTLRFYLQVLANVVANLPACEAVRLQRVSR